MISLISSLSLKLYLNSLVYHRNIFGSSPKVFRNLWKFSEISRECWETFVLPSEQFWKIFQNHRKVVGNLPKIVKMPSSVCLFKLKKIHVSSKIWILCSSGKNNISRVSALSDHFPKISEDFPKLFRRQDERSRTISEDCRRLLRKTRRCFDHTPANLSTI